MNQHTTAHSRTESLTTKNSVRVWRGVFLAFSVALIGLIVWASLEKNVLDIFRVLFAERWGIVTLVDLYGGFLVSSIWISVLERRARRIVPWIVGILLLGNLVTALYVLWRLRGVKSVTQAFTQLSPSASGEQRSA